MRSDLPADPFECHQRTDLIPPLLLLAVSHRRFYTGYLVIRTTDLSPHTLLQCGDDDCVVDLWQTELRLAG